MAIRPVLLWLVTALVSWAPLPADEIRVAVASNFAHAAREIGVAFEEATGHTVALAFGSTGKHYAQIRNGAPMDVLLAADDWRPELLEDEGLAVSGSRRTYALGRLVLWSRDPTLIDSEGDVLRSGAFRFLAVANPKLAPYGAAAKEVLEHFGVWDALEGRIVRGENVGQALQYVDSGNADLAFIAVSQLTEERRASGSLWKVPSELHSPIRQQALLLRDLPAARQFMAFLDGGEAAAIIDRFGYEVP